ncbi:MULTISPECIES: DUF6783 domain-containing protein [Lachnospiraceae]|uniref:DUF6783 domain-containing protein n=1 Tax=Blautia sp. AM42-2 TaxID=2292976 RepID=UPI002FE5B0A0
MQAPLCSIFCPHSVAVARYAALIRTKSPTNWDSQLAKSLFQTRSRKRAEPFCFFPEVSGSFSVLYSYFSAESISTIFPYSIKCDAFTRI